MTRLIALAALAFLAASFPGAASATEAVAGRYIPGAFAAPMAGAMPPPGFYWSSNTVYYHGSAGASLQVPIAGEVRLGMKADIVGQTFTGFWVPDVQIAPNTSIGLSLSIPVQYLDATAMLGGRQLQESQVALGDIALTPRIGWNSGKHFFSASLSIFAPTGEWEKGALDNIGLNYWTFSPTLAYTYFDHERGWDLSLLAGIDINTENRDTDYHSGALAHLDALAMKHFNERFAAGIFGSILYQIEDDEGGIADQLDGFKGRSFAIGPILKYTAGSKEKPISLSFSWAPEFGTENRTKGHALYFSVAGKF